MFSRRYYSFIYTKKAEAALGRPLPKKAEVHHVDGDFSNNENKNLVICPSRFYHMLLHIRTEALGATGNADLRKCAYCGMYDYPHNLWNRRDTEIYRHKACHRLAVSRAKAP